MSLGKILNFAFKLKLIAIKRNLHNVFDFTYLGGFVTFLFFGGR